MARWSPSQFIPILWVGLVVVSIVATLAARPDWWTWIAPEASLAREISTAMLLATSALAFVIWLQGHQGHGSRQRFGRETTAMALLSVGFFVLAVDERVALHERLRDRVLAPRGVSLPFIPWGEPGDVVLVVVAIVGLLLLWPVLQVVAADRRALVWFVVGVVLAVAAVALDTLPIETYQLRNEIYFQSGEEAIELMAAACFLSSMLCLGEGCLSGSATTGGSGLHHQT